MKCTAKLKLTGRETQFITWLYQFVYSGRLNILFDSKKEKVGAVVTAHDSYRYTIQLAQANSDTDGD